MKDYYNDLEATAHASRGGWMHTGTAGGGEISSIEVESILLKHPAVQEGAVVLQHKKWGEASHAFV
jgi:fatty-acyl-CoA synthase